METVQSSIESAGTAPDASRARVVLFDFDGTLSLIRSGWVDVMVPMMIECLLELNTGESEQDLTDTVGDYVARLTGKQTIYQMIELADQIRQRGGQPLEPLEYKRMYLSRLDDKIRDRVEGLRAGSLAPDELLVPGARRLLEALSGRGLKLYLASGTDQPYLREEAGLLQIDSYFDGRIFGALDNYQSFSKQILIGKIISESDFAGKSSWHLVTDMSRFKTSSKSGGLPSAWPRTNLAASASTRSSAGGSWVSAPTGSSQTFWPTMS